MKHFSILFFILFILGNASLIAQSFSNKGTDFWVTYPAHIDGTASIMGIYITATTNATGSITVNGKVVPFTVSANTVTEKFIGSSAAADASNSYVYLANNGITTGAAIHVVSNDNPVVVYAHIIHSAHSGATLLLPSNVWGKQYIVPSYSSIGNAVGSGYGTISIVAANANTSVQITPAATTLDQHTPGTSYTITLANPGDVYQMEFERNADISGTLIQSVSNSGTCQKIAVFSSTTWSAFGCIGSSSGDNLFQQLFPNSSWGENFATVPAKTRNSDIFRVYVTDPSTVVNKTENGISSVLTGLVNTGVPNSYYYEFSTGNATYLQASNPVSVVQYFTTMACENGAIIGDPEMIVLNPIEQTINNITVFSAHKNWINTKFPGQSNITNCYLNIVIRSNATSSFKINGVAQTGFQPITGTSYSYLQADVTNITLSNPVQNLTADSNFIAIAYGLGNVESYGYNAGTNVKDFTQIASFQNKYVTLDSPIACVNTPFKFSVPLSFQPTTIQWDFSKAPDINPNTGITSSSPAANLDSNSLISGLYYYSTKNAYTFIAPNTAAKRDTIKVYTTSATPDGCGSSSQIYSIPVSVYPIPSANFTISSSACINTTFRFLDSTNTYGTSTVFTGLWDFGDGTIDSAFNPTKTYTNAQTYNVRYRPITTYGCMGDTTIPIFFSSPPIARFAYSDSCVGQVLTFSDSSSIAVGTIVKWYWDYGDGTKDTLSINSARQKTYHFTGTYTVSLITVSNSGCISIPFVQQITIRPSPQTNFALPLAVCLPKGIANFNDSTFIPLNGTIINWKWDFGDGNKDSVQNPVHIYADTGLYIVKLTATSNYGCSKDSSKSLKNIYLQPKAGFAVNAYTCLRDTTFYTDSSNGNGSAVVKWRWNFGDGSSDTLQNTSHIYKKAAIDTVSLYVYTDKGCISDTISKITVANPLPLAGFYSTALNNSYCEKRPVSFIDTSKNQSIDSAAITRWYWNMGDGDIKNLNSGGFNTTFNEFYPAFNAYTVKLMVENSLGCKSDTVVSVLTIHGLPSVGFTLPEVCLADKLANFTDTTSFPDGSTAANYFWTYNAGSPSISPGPSLLTSAGKDGSTQYNNYGNYQISLQVTSTFGCDSVLKQPFTVNGSLPHASFVVLNNANLCSNDSIGIFDSSYVDFGKVTRNDLYWNYIDINSADSTDSNPYLLKDYFHKYPNFTSPSFVNYQVKMVAHSGSSNVCMDSVTKIVTIHQSPAVQFNPVRGFCRDTIPQSIANAAFDIGGVAFISRTFSGIGVDSTGIYSPGSVLPGNYPIMYRIITPYGCRDSASQSVTVWPSPVAKWGINSPDCERNNIIFTDSSIANYSKIANRYWSFGDTNDSVLAYKDTLFSRGFNKYGNYVVQLQVITDSGCRSIINSQLIKINPLPVVSFSLPSVCLPGGNGQFLNTSTIADGSEPLFSYLWNFGDNNNNTPSTLQSPVHQYSALGPYTVSLQITTKDGCIDSLKQQLNTVYPQPKAAFLTSKTEVCVNDKISFTDNSNGISGAITSWHWSINTDSLNNNSPSILPSFTDSGLFTVKLFVYNQENCISDTVSQQILVNPYPVLKLGPDLVVLQGRSIRIIPQYIYGDSLSYVWNPGTYLNSDTASEPISTPAVDIHYQLFLTGIGNCSVSDTINITVLKTPEIPTAFSPNGDGINDTWVIKYLNSYPGATVDVFDRDGQPVFHSEGYNINWDGTFNGKPLPIGTYYYIINPKNGRALMSGPITIIR